MVRSIDSGAEIIGLLRKGQDQSGRSGREVIETHGDCLLVANQSLDRGTKSSVTKEYVETTRQALLSLSVKNPSIELHRLYRPFDNARKVVDNPAKQDLARKRCFRR